MIYTGLTNYPNFMYAGVDIDYDEQQEKLFPLGSSSPLELYHQDYTDGTI
jgi:hypothetical protein